MIARLVSIVSCLGFAVLLLASGFAACTLPIATQVLAEHSVAAETSPYTHEDLVVIAQETRAFTVDNYDRTSDENTSDGDAAACERLAQSVLDAAQRSSSADTKTKSRWSDEALALVDAASTDASSTSATETMFALSALGEQYAFDKDALSHLQDCHSLIVKAGRALSFVAAISFALLAMLLVASRKNAALALPAARALQGAPLVMVAFLALCGIWARIDFNGFFSVFHQLFFPQGNWTFPETSLLISALPLGFWVGMAALWAVVSFIAAIICFSIGRAIQRKVSHG